MTSQAVTSPAIGTEEPHPHLGVGAESPYAAYWHPIAESHEVTDQPKQFWLLNEPLVGFRTDEGIGVFKDLCIHRGAQLSLGWVANGRLACPYHGFEYDVTGACTRIPSIPEGQSIPRKARAQAYRVQEAFGLVWVAMRDPVAGLPEWPNGEWGSEGKRSIMAHRCVWNAGAGRVVENFLDVSHFPFVHEGFLGSRDDTLIEPYETVELDGGLYYKHMQQEPGDPHTGEGELVTLEYHLTAPFACHLRRTTPNGDWSMFSIFASPRTDKTSDIFLPIVRGFDLDPSSDDVFAGIIKRAMDEDQAVVEGQRPEELPVDLSEELHIKVPDAAGVVYRRLLREIERGGAARANGDGAAAGAAPR